MGTVIIFVRMFSMLFFDHSTSIHWWGVHRQEANPKARWGFYFGVWIPIFFPWVYPHGKGVDSKSAFFFQQKIKQWVDLSFFVWIFNYLFLRTNGTNSLFEHEILPLQIWSGFVDLLNLYIFAMGVSAFFSRGSLWWFWGFRMNQVVVELMQLG